MRLPRIPLAITFTLLAALAAVPGAAAAEPLIAQAMVDTTFESEPAPLLIPGRASAADSAVSKAKRADEQFKLAVALERINPGAAVVAYRSAVILDPTFPEANYRAGMLLVQHGMVQQAIQAFSAEIRNSPAHVDAHLELGMALSELGYHEPAIARMESLSVALPDDDRAWHALGFVYSNADRKDLAEEALRRAIRLEPKRAIEHRDLGVLLASMGRDRDARIEYQRSLAIDGDDATVWFNLGNLERNEDNDQKALEHYREAEKRDSSFWLARRGQIEVLMKLDRVDDVAEVFERHLERQPESHEVRLAAVRYYEQYGTPGQSTALARRGVQMFPLEGEAHVVLARSLAREHDYRGALTSYVRGLERTVMPNQRQEIESMIAALKESSPDSLKAMFHPDSIATLTAAGRKRLEP